MFTWQAAYGIKDCTDGTSNTIAFSEAAVRFQSEQPGQKLIGLQGVQIPLTSMLFDASTNPVTTNAVIQLCNAADNSRSASFLDLQRGENWAHGSMAMAMFNTIVTPNAFNDTWTHCGLNASSGAVLSNADSYHPGGVNCLFSDGSVKFIKDSINQRTLWALGTGGTAKLSAATAIKPLPPDRSRRRKGLTGPGWPRTLGRSSSPVRKRCEAISESRSQRRGAILWPPGSGLRKPVLSVPEGGDPWSTSPSRSTRGQSSCRRRSWN
jgi:prepilin-type processing-associated H-X9-DG protein